MLVCMIDSLAHVEYVDTKACPFIDWLRSYAQLDGLGITAEELWEHRNSLLHMSNLDSRRVRAGATRRLMMYVGELPAGVPRETEEAKYFDFRALVFAVADACGRWFQSYNVERSKIDQFVERYDRITSDNRMFWFDLSGRPA